MDKKKIISTDKAEAVCGGRPDNSPRPAGRQQVCPYCHQVYNPGVRHNCQYSRCIYCGRLVPRGFICDCRKR